MRSHMRTSGAPLAHPARLPPAHMLAHADTKAQTLRADIHAARCKSGCLLHLSTSPWLSCHARELEGSTGCTVTYLTAFTGAWVLTTVCPCFLQDLAHTLRTRLAEQGRFVAPKRPQHAFAIEHYAGRVTYSSELLLDKNKVPPPHGLICAAASCMKALQGLLHITRPCRQCLLASRCIHCWLYAGMLASGDKHLVREGWRSKRTLLLPA